MSETSPTTRVNEVQSLRAIAILLVAGYHYFSSWTMPIDGNNLYPGTLAGLFRYSWLGVELFFMVSGFVISMTLLRSRNAAEFLARRVIRLWPALLLALPVVFIVGNIGPEMYAHPLAHLFTSFTLIDPMLLNHLLPLSVDWVTAVLWTMWVEIQFYVLSALLFFVLRTRFVPALALVTGVATALTWFPVWGWASDERIAALLPAIAWYLPWFLAGAIFHAIWSSRRVRPWHSLALAVCLANVGWRLWYHAEIHAIWLPIAFFVAFTAITLRWRVAAPLRMSALVFLGEISYEFYLVHDTVGVTIITALVDRFGFSAGPHLLGAVLGGGASLALAVVIYRITTPWRAAATRFLRRQSEMTAVS